MASTVRAGADLGIAALVASGFAIAQVPVHAAGLPVPCPGSSACSRLSFDPLNTRSLLPAGVSQIVTSGSRMTINQGPASSAIFNWASFNISPGSTVQFIQPSASAVALNRIFDPNVTTIAGNLKANGQIYLINPNGILFGSGANVNVGGLIASTLDVSDQRITSGLLSDPILADPVLSSNAAVTGSTLSASAGANPAIQVQSGATLYAAGRDQSGTVVSAGRIFLFAPTVENAGSITVDGGGQVILAAGSNIYLGSSTEPSLRGLLVEVTGSSASGVTIDPSGSISVAHGNITLMGLAVTQSGALTATSALDANGSIRLIAREADPTTTSSDPAVLFAAATTGQVTLSSGSQTKVVLDPNDTATAPLNDPTAAALRSSIEIEGLAITIGSNGAPGSTVVQARGGDISVTARAASSTLPTTVGVGYQIGNGDILGANNAASVINVGADATIDASGLQNVAVDGARNFVYISPLTSNNLANAPYQRTGFLLGQGVYLNLAQAPSWLDVSNLQAAVAGTQAERNATAGTISLNAEGAVNLAAGSVVNVSGGSIDVSAALGRTSQLITANGSVVDISKASADVQYVGFADQGSYTLADSNEGINHSISWQAPVYTQAGGYTEGTNAGTLRIYAPQVQLDGNLLGQTTAAAQQRLAPPLGAMLQIGSANPGQLDSEAGISRASIVLSSDPATAAQLVVSVASGTPIVLDTTALHSGGFTRLDLTSDGIIELAPGSPLDLGPAGSLTMRANAIAIDSAIQAPGGSVSLSERPLTSLPSGDTSFTDLTAQRNYLNSVTAPNLRGSVHFAQGTSVDTAGLWTNDLVDSPVAVPSEPIVLNGGSIAISGRTVDVSGTSFNVSAGASLSQSGVFAGGNGGSLSLKGSYVLPGALASTDQGVLVLGTDFASRIAGFGVGTGGSLSLAAPSIAIAAAGSAMGGLVVDPAIADTGFQKFSFSAYDSAFVGANTAFTPVPRKLQDSALLNLTASATALTAITAPVAPLPGKTDPASISISANNAYTGTVDIGSGSLVDAGAGGSIALNAGANVNVEGALIAQGGSLSASLSSPPTAGMTLAALDQRGIVIGSGARLDVSGTSLVTVDSRGLRSGNVLDAGSVALHAPAGAVAIEAGATIATQGASDLVDIPVQGAQYQRQLIGSNGGTVDLIASTSLIVEGAINAKGGLPSSPGGNLSASLVDAPAFGPGSNLASAIIQQFTLPLNLNITSLLPAMAAQPTFAATANQGYLSPTLLNTSGFDNVWLQSPDRITFGPAVGASAQQLSVRGSLTLAAPGLAAANGESTIITAPLVTVGPAEKLSTATVAAGQSLNPAPLASGGSGSLAVNATQIDLVGTVALQGIGQTRLNSTGDVQAIGVANPLSPGARTSGSLQYAGALEIDAAQLYPSTQSDYTFGGPGVAAGGPMVVGSAGAGAPPAPLSAGGSLSFDVASLSVSGRVLAPLGQISVNTPGTLTLESGSLLSVTGSGLVPYGSVQNSSTWTYGVPSTIGNSSVAPYTLASPSGVAVAPKGINLNAGTLDAKPGSTVRIAGGGDVLGTGFVAGPGGSYDMSLNFPYPSAPTTPNLFFALVPARGATPAPFDTQIYADLVQNPGLTSAGSAAFAIGRTITIAGGSGLPAGTYTILPARYALLPGAYAVEAVASYQDMMPNSAVAMPDGTAIVAGRIGDTAAGTIASRWSGFRVYSSSQFRTLSEFQDFTGSTFFDSVASALASPLPRTGVDAGFLQVDAPYMALTGAIQAQPEGTGRGADIGIDASLIIVADNHTARPGAAPTEVVFLDASTLSGLGAETLVLGALDQHTTSVAPSGAITDTLSLTNPVASQSVAVLAHNPLVAGELILSSGSVSVVSGAQLLASPSAAPPTNALTVHGDGALLYVGSELQAPSYLRASASAAGTATTGDLTVGNAQVTGNSILLDGTHSETYGSAVALQASAIDISAPLVNLGSVPANAPGLNLNPALLASLGSARDLTITTLGGIDIYGSATLGQLDGSGNAVLRSVTLAGPGISGFGAGGQSAQINAGQIVLENVAGSNIANAGTGQGNLTLNAVADGSNSGNIEVSGNITLGGYQGVSLIAAGRQASGQTVAGTGDMVFTGAAGASSTLALGGTNTSLDISATRVTAQRGVNAAITVPGALTISASGPASAAQTAELGASLQVSAQNITMDGRIDLPSGVVSLQATGATASDGITLGAGSLIRVAGVTQDFASTTADASAGTISLASSAGSVTEAAGAALDISGAGTLGAAGALNISAIAGTVSLAGAVGLAPGSQARAAQVSIDVGQMSNVGQIATALNTGSALDSLFLRARSGDLVVGGGAAPTVLAARSITLEADGGAGTTDGSIHIAGVLNAGGASGGQIALYANNQASVDSGSVLDVHASAPGQSAGQVVISARVNATPGAPTSLDAVVLNAGATVNLSGGAGGSDGVLTLRAPINTAGNDVQIAPVPSGVIVGGNASKVVEAVVVDSHNGNLTVDANLMAAEAATLASVMSSSNRAAMTQRLGFSSADPNFHLRPGLEILSTGNMTVTDPIDFSAGLLSATTGAGSFQWRYGGSTLASSEPGALTLRSGGTLSIQANISDGFLNSTDPSTGLPVSTLWSTGNSWRYTLTGGADLAAANPNATIAGAADLTVGTASEPGVTVRTGTGSIALNSGRDIALLNDLQQQDNVVYTAGNANVAGAPAFPILPITDVNGNYVFIRPVLAQGGGDLSITAQRDVLGTDSANQDGSTQTVNEWLYRYGAGTQAQPTAWWTDFSSFQQGFGALGGGNLNIQAGGNLVRVDAVVPSNGYAIGGSVSERNTGSLTVRAGGSIMQGLYYDEAGAMSVAATALVSNPNATLPQLSKTMFAQGNDTLQISARESATFALPFNPTIVPANAINSSNVTAPMFFTYGAKSTLDIQVAAGDLSVTAMPGGASTLVQDTSGPNYTVIPTNVLATAFGGRILGGGVTLDLFQYPDANGQLQLLADGNIANLRWTMSQADPGALPTPPSPAQPVAANMTTPLDSATPLHASDPTLAEVVSRNGSLTAVALNLPKTSEISAGANIGPYAAIDIQNSNANSLSSVLAGSQINMVSGTPYDHIYIAGPGAAQIIAGGSINLGTDGGGIDSRGNLDNLHLPAQGASLIVAAGAGTQIANNAPLAATPNYRNLIDNFVLYDAFAASGSKSATLNSQVIAALNADPILAPLATALSVGLSDRASASDPTSTFQQDLAQIAHSSPALLAVGAVKLAAAIQVVANQQFVQSANTETFAPAYAAFNDLFPNLSANENVIRQFVLNNPFAKATNPSALQASVLQGLPSALVNVIDLGLAAPSSVNQPDSAFSRALSAIDPATLGGDARALFANVLQVAGTSRDQLSLAGQLTGSGSPYAKELTALAVSFTPQTAAGLNDLQMDYSQIKAEQSGSIAVFAPQGGVVVGASSAPALDTYAKKKTAAQLGIFTLGGGDIIGMARDNFDVYRSRVFTVAGGDIDLWSSQGNIDAGRGARDVTVASPPQLQTDPNTGVQFLNFGASVTGSGIGALETVPDQPPSNINLMAPAGYVDAGEAGIRAQTGTVTLGTNLVLNGSNIQAASGISGGAVVASPPPPVPASSNASAGDRAAGDVQGDILAQQRAAEQLAATQMQVHVSGEFLGFANPCTETAEGKTETDCYQTKKDTK